MNRTLILLVVTAYLTVPIFVRAQTNEAAPLPPLAIVLSHAAEAAAREDYYEKMFNSRYVYERSRVTETRYSDGKLKNREAKYNTNNPTPAVAFQPLPHYKPESAAEAADAKKNRKQLIDVTELVTNVLANSQLRIVRREVANGRSTLVVDFRPPDKTVPEDNLMDRLVNRAAGRAWVDEGDYTLVRLQTHLTDKLNVFVGFGAVLKGDYSFDRERTPEGVWYSREVKYNADIRQFIFYRTINYREMYINVSRPRLPALAATTR